MAAISVTATGVIPVAGASISTGVLGEAVTAGQAIYKAADGLWYLAQADGTAIQARCTGIATQGGSAGQTICIFTGGDIDLGATLGVGETYVLGATAGAIYPIADIQSSEYVTILGVASAADNLKSLFYASETEHA